MPLWHCTKFPEKYLVIFEQPIDHEDPAKGTFTQRVVVGIVHPDSATVVVTEGYGAQYAFVPSYRDEISTIFNTNNIVVEHRHARGGDRAQDDIRREMDIHRYQQGRPEHHDIQDILP